jgi:AbrB family looped-hinge helix DNA binding protein
VAASARNTSKARITIPKEVRDRLGLKAGDRLEFYFTDGHWEVRPVRRRSIEAFRGLFAMEHTLPFQEERELAWQARMRELDLGRADVDE